MLVWVNKPIGLSPKDCTDKLKKENVKVGFAGRLDPLAYGLLPLVINDKGAVLQSSVMNKDKVYQFKMICGLSSTTFDILGRVTLLDHVQKESFYVNSLKEYVNKKEQILPKFCSKRVPLPGGNKNVPLWSLSIEGKETANITNPIDIKYIKILGTKVRSGRFLLEKLKKYIKLIPEHHNFDYKSILLSWESLVEKEFYIIHAETLVSKGTFIRSICNECNGVGYDICRTSIKGEKDIIPSKYEFSLCETLTDSN